MKKDPQQQNQGGHPSFRVRHDQDQTVAAGQELVLQWTIEDYDRLGQFSVTLDNTLMTYSVTADYEIKAVMICDNAHQPNQRILFRLNDPKLGIRDIEEWDLEDDRIAKFDFTYSFDAGSKLYVVADATEALSGFIVKAKGSRSPRVQCRRTPGTEVR